MENSESFLNEAKKQEIKAQYLQDFHAFRHDRIDDIPSQRLLPGDPNYSRYKCRGNFWNSVASRLENLRDFGIINDPKIDKFIQFLRDSSPDYSKFTTKEDIEEINKGLDYVIETLS